MAEKTPSVEILQRYLSNNCSDSERQIVDAWYQTLSLQSSDEFTKKHEDELLQRIQAQIPKENTVSPMITRPVNSWWLYASAAAAMVILVLGFLFYGSKLQPSGEQTLANQNLTFKMVNNQKKAIHYILPDSSAVWLQPGASIEHPKSFAQKSSREIYFEGEGFFDVSKDRSHPFIIHSGKLKTVVVGTSFNVKAKRNDQTYQVSVVSGSVSVTTTNAANKNETLLLKPQQQAIFETTTNSLTLNNLENKKSGIETWQPVSLNFEDVVLADIVARLQKTFKVKITVASPSLNNCTLKVDFNNQNLPEILEMISTLLAGTYETDGQHVILSGEGCEAQ